MNRNAPHWSVDDHRRLTAAAGEALLDGGPGPAALRQLIDAATAPATADELSSEHAARRAFRAATIQLPVQRSGPHGPPSSNSFRRPSRKLPRRSTPLRARAVLTLVLTVAATTGVALAATAATTSLTAAPSSATSAVPGRSATQLTDSPTPVPAPATAPAGSAAPSQPSSEPYVPELCRAWTARNGNRGAASADPAFDALIGAAHGPEKVATFCKTAQSPNAHIGGTAALAGSSPGLPTPGPRPAPLAQVKPTGAEHERDTAANRTPRPTAINAGTPNPGTPADENTQRNQDDQGNQSKQDSQGKQNDQSNRGNQNNQGN